MNQREFAQADIEAMIALSRASAICPWRIADLPYRFSSWALDDPHYARLWVDAAGRLRAWAVMQVPFWTIDYTCDPAAGAGLHRQILAWADRRAREILDTPRGLPSWYVTVLPGQAERIRDLEAAGFTPQADRGEDSWSKVLMARPAEAPLPEHPLPTGCTLRPLAGEGEVEAYVQLHRAAFETRNMTAEWRARTLRRPEHLPALDLVAVAPDGRLAAFCIGWLSRIAGQLSGQVEPLGVHPSFRQLGLGRAILAEGLRRLHDCGAAQVYVETDNHRGAAFDLYESAGFRVIQDVLVYGKEYRS